MKRTGVVKMINQQGRFGFVTDDAGEDYFIPMHLLGGGGGGVEPLVQGDRVQFVGEITERGLRCTAVRAVAD